MLARVFLRVNITMKYNVRNRCEIDDTKTGSRYHFSSPSHLPPGYNKKKIRRRKMALNGASLVARRLPIPYHPCIVCEGCVHEDGLSLYKEGKREI